MTELLQKAFAEASRLPAPEQDALAAWLLDELTSERRWQAAFSGSRERLRALGAEALVEHREGRTKELDPDAL